MIRGERDREWKTSGDHFQHAIPGHDEQNERGNRGGIFGEDCNSDQRAGEQRSIIDEEKGPRCEESSGDESVSE